MEVYFISRGMNEQVEKFIKYLETWILPMPYTDKEGNNKTIGFQGNLKPVQLWGYTFPKEQKDLVLSSLGLAGKDSHIGWLNKYTYPLRKLLKLNPIGEYNKVPVKYVGKEFVTLLPIGIKEDLPDKVFPDGTTREFL